MARNTSVTVVCIGLRKLGEGEAKLQALRTKLEEGENSGIVKNFDGERFLKNLHKKYCK